MIFFIVIWNSREKNAFSFSTLNSL